MNGPRVIAFAVIVAFAVAALFASEHRAPNAGLPLVTPAQMQDDEGEPALLTAPCIVDERTAPHVGEDEA